MLGFYPLASRPLGAFRRASAAYLRFYPSSDVSVGNWLSTDASLYAAIDETTPSDADYIYTPAPSIAQVGLQAVTDPGVTTGLSLFYRARSANGAQSLTVRLKQGTTVIASETRTSVPTAETTFQLSLSSAQAASITNFSDLRVELEAL